MQSKRLIPLGFVTGLVAAVHLCPPGAQWLTWLAIALVLIVVIPRSLWQWWEVSRRDNEVDAAAALTQRRWAEQLQQPMSSARRRSLLQDYGEFQKHRRSNHPQWWQGVHEAATVNS